MHHPFWNSHPHHPQHPIRNGAGGHIQNDHQSIMQMFINLENQITNLVKAIEANNELLRQLEQKQNQVVTSGGGSVIVRM
ncbi:hypothetical protein [Bacillus sp. AFS055030]|uniref:hypothetical protein n=1 Tax=Bacillus sp. AFS055030 TaxID=2033507 RepID=UPI000BFE9B26|nr:hypothetical protein [Bacillus sp. AFS055030]PGL67254.1 hypothetical protein CN925_20045 [Bacillus sp. AFS055030]